jgi:sugar O-acyltransferase (sialic acid O-acetyltransferase NeuD family)
MAKVVVFGAGRGADVAYRYLTRDSEHEVVGFTVDASYLSSEEFRGLPVVPFEDVESRFPPDDYRMFIVLGYQDMNHLRAQKYNDAKGRGYRFVSYAASDIFRIEDLDVGENCFLLDNQSINLDVKIGDNVVMWSSNHIGDMTVIEDHCWISSHCTVAANVVVKEHSFLGIGATVSNHVVVEPESFVGADVLITENTKPSGVYLPGKSGCVSQDSRAFMKVLEACNKL